MFDDISGRSTYLEPMMSLRPENWSHLKNPSEEKKIQSAFKLTTLFWLGGIPLSAVVKCHDQNKDTVSICCAERVRAATVRSGGDDPGCAAGVGHSRERSTAWMRTICADKPNVCIS